MLDVNVSKVLRAAFRTMDDGCDKKGSNLGTFSINRWSLTKCTFPKRD